MPIFTKDDTTVLFIHVPKAAGTSIEHILVENGYQISYRRGGVYGPLNEFDRENGCSPQHLHAELLEKHLGDRRFSKIFTIVRHPIHRFASEYRFRVDSGHPLAADGINTFCEKALNRFKRNPFVLDNHIRPQVDFPWRGCTVYKLENGMDAVLDALSEELPEPLLSDGVPAMRSLARVADELTPYNKRRLFEFYKADFEAYGYSYDW